MQKSRIKIFLFYFALVGWMLSLSVHLLSIFDIDVKEIIPFVWLLHIGIFAVWLPIILELKNNEELKQFQKSVMLKKRSSFGLYKIYFKGVPIWLKTIAIAGFIYAIFNFTLFFFAEQGTPAIWDGKFVLHNHGHLLKYITEQEFKHFKARDLRGFSGHWIAFYGIATAFLFKYSGLTKTNQAATEKLQ